MQQNQDVGSGGGRFRISVANTDLKFRDLDMRDPVPTGRQIVEAAGGRPPDDFIVLKWAADGDIEEIDRDETTDLRKPGSERFIIAKSDRTFRFEIDGHKHEWPEGAISREVLLALASQDPEKFSVWQDLGKTGDKEVLAGHPADLTGKATEVFYTVMKHTTEGGK